MVLDYSKWDALELSDDSDVEVHPNVDKRSFIRAKQNQIHQQRLERKHQIQTLKLLASLHKFVQTGSGGSADKAVWGELVETASMEDDVPPPRPAGVYEHVKDKPMFSNMLAALLDQVKQAVDKSEPADRTEAYTKEIESHKKKVTDLQGQLLVKLAELEKEEGKKITSESIHTGFDRSSVAKSQAQNSVAVTKNSIASSTPELLNPTRPSLTSESASGYSADVEDATPGDPKDTDEEASASPAAKKFAQIKIGDYRSSLQFISQSPNMLSEKETDGLLVEAFNAQTDFTENKTKGKDVYARQCVHQALLLQYCRQLGRDGVQLFFKRITTPGHQAQKLFLDDVNSTYTRIASRTKELAAERAKEEQEGTAAGRGGGGVEQIQLHAVDPNTSINIIVPKPGSDDATEIRAREVFESFPPGLQRALESGSLDRVNEVLGKMSVEEAEEVVEKLGEGGMLSLEEGVIDATTEEGRERVREIEKTGKMPGAGVVGDEEMD
ncbi:hsp90 co-chaperone Cdc37 [Elasticomyces elasticus]|nr:hsp90 co-chaperone Cdc37 [Elasticomyces elasticus]